MLDCAAVRYTATVLVLFFTTSTTMAAQDTGNDAGNGKKEQDTRASLEIFGRLSGNIIYDFKRTNPEWFDVLRVSKLPAFRGEFGKNRHTWFSVRPSSVGLKPTLKTRLGDIKGRFEWDLFGTGRDAGRTTFNLQFAYIEIGKFGLGKYYSPFMEIDVFPNSLEYWGPSGIVFFRNVQFRYMPVQGDSRVTIALERPGASGDHGDDNPDAAAGLELANVVGRFPWPDLSAEARWGGAGGFIKLAGILRALYWDDLNLIDRFDLDGSAFSWGLSLSAVGNIFERDRLKLQATYGEAIQNFLDAPFDIGFELQRGNITQPFRGVALPVFAMLAFYDRWWSDRWSSSIGYSRIDVDNSDGQSVLAFHSGQYALANLLFRPLPELLVGAEVQWGRRSNAFDDFSFNDFRVQFTGRFNYSVTFGNRGAVTDGN